MNFPFYRYKAVFGTYTELEVKIFVLAMLNKT